MEITARKSKLQKPSTGQLQYGVHRAFRHEGTLYVAGDIIATDEATAQRWVELGCLELLLGAR
jgi:hypothetical protein